MIGPDTTKWFKNLFRGRSRASSVAEHQETLSPKLVWSKFENDYRSRQPIPLNRDMAINRVSHYFGISPGEVERIMSTSIPSRDDLQERIQYFIKNGFTQNTALRLIASETGIPAKKLREILTTSQEDDSPDRNLANKVSTEKWSIWASLFNENRNKFRCLIANILIILGLLLIYDSIEIRSWRHYSLMQINNLFEFIISIILILNGAILFVKSATVYFKKD